MGDEMTDSSRTSHERVGPVPQTVIERVHDAAVWARVHAERIRAHSKHQDTSMEEMPVDGLDRLAIFVEEMGEVAREFNNARHERRPLDLAKLAKELTQCAAMSGAWADAAHRAEEDRLAALPSAALQENPTVVLHGNPLDRHWGGPGVR